MCPSVTAPDAVRALVEHAKASELPELAGELARGLAEVLARTAIPPTTPTAAPLREEGNALLTVDEAAARLGVARSWLYRHAKALPFAVKLGHRTLRFEQRGLERWARTRPAV